MKANKFNQTVNQVPKEWGITIPDSIDDACKDYFHVLIVKRTHLPEQETYSTSAIVQQFNVEAWSRKGGVKENLPMLGYTKTFILHDPTVKEEVKEEVKAEVKKPAGRPKKKQIDFED
jgi:hypothetical protein